MITFDNDQVTQVEDLTDFDNIGIVTLAGLGVSIPYYGFQGDQRILRYSEDQCDGDCFEYFTSNFNMYWSAIESGKRDTDTWVR